MRDNRQPSDVAASREGVLSDDFGEVVTKLFGALKVALSTSALGIDIYGYVKQTDGAEARCEGNETGGSVGAREI